VLIALAAVLIGVGVFMAGRSHGSHERTSGPGGMQPPPGAGGQWQQPQQGQWQPPQQGQGQPPQGGQWQPGQQGQQPPGAGGQWPSGPPGPGDDPGASEPPTRRY
jgi:hypothetical protein